MSDNIPDSLCKFDGYSFLRVDRIPNVFSKSKGGGVIVFYKSNILLNHVDIDFPKYYTFHNCEILCLDNSLVKCRIFLIYRPPYITPQQTTELVNHVKMYCTDPKMSYVFLGDFNLPNIKWSYSPPTNVPSSLMDLILELNLTQHVDFPTRYNLSTNASNVSNCLDLIFSSNNCILNVKSSTPLLFSDHNSISFDFSFANTMSASNCKPSYKPYLLYHKCDFERLNRHLLSFNWDKQLSYFSNVDSKLYHFTKIFNELITQYTPTSKGKKIIKNIPKYNIFMRKLHHHYPNNRIVLKRKYKKLVKTCKSHIIRLEKNSLSKRPKELFRFVKSRIKSNTKVHSLIVNNELITNPIDVADSFVKCFSSHLSPPTEAFPTLPAKKPDDLYISVSPITIINIIKKLSPKVGFSTDNINFYVIKKCMDVIALPLSIIFQESLSSNIYPAAWKASTIVPIHKKGSVTNALNYRPVTLTHPLSRLFERVIMSQIRRQMSSKLSPRQYGFINSRSCTLANIEYISNCKQLISKGEFVDCIYFDFKKAFDSVPHSLLLLKLSLFGFNDHLCSWFSSFLSNRTSNVKVSNAFSSVDFQITSGVCQGTVSGPFLFLVYINDLIDSFPEDVYISVFADDVKLYGNNPCSLQYSIDLLCRWCNVWKLSLAESKTHVLHFGKTNPRINYIINDVSIDVSPHIRDLGLIVDNKLTFHNHIVHINKICMLKCRQLLSSFKSTNPQFLLKLFNCYVRPILEYGCEIFHPSTKQPEFLLEQPQRFFTRRVCQRCNIKYKSYEDRLIKLNMKSIVIRRLELIIKTYYKILTNQYHCPVLNQFVTFSRSPRYPLMLKANTPVKFCKNFFISNLSLWNRVCKYFININPTVQNLNCIINSIPRELIY